MAERTRTTRSKAKAQLAEAAPPAAPEPTRTTRAKTTAKKATVPKSAAPEPAKPKRAAKKPATGKENTAESAKPVKPASSTSSLPKSTSGANSHTSEREPIMVYLRLRPPHSGEEEEHDSPYLTLLDDTSVRMTDDQNRERHRASALPQSAVYKFSHVFPGNTSQGDFFVRTALPLVKDVLQGQNGLLFAYGVTNSGKTYTVQGGSNPGSAGMLPRTLDVIFNSVEGLQGSGKFRPVRLNEIEPNDDSQAKIPSVGPLSEALNAGFEVPLPSDDYDPTTVQLDRNYEYTVWLSYAEVYNEKVYDLLESEEDQTTKTTFGRTASVLTRKALALRPCQSSNEDDAAVKGKYISGLRQFRIHSAAEAKELLRLGQLNRRVFGTVANRESSRSHGMVILSVVRGHRGEKNDPTSLQVSRLTIVDLAGSERTKHTHTTGDRLKEAGNINKSLMVLGQCMEVLRSNQRKLAQSLSQEVARMGRLDTRDIKKNLAVVPFRYSKLTEALMDYFVGDGKVVMVVNVNPYETGYDENVHAMKFASLTREILVNPAPAATHTIGKTVGKSIKKLGPMTLSHPDLVPVQHTRKVTLPMSAQAGSKRAADRVVSIVEEDETDHSPGEDDEHDDPINPLVDALFDEVEELRMQLFESEMRCALIEQEVREEITRDMEERMRAMEKRHAKRLQDEMMHHEQKMDAKIDLLYESGMFASPQKARAMVLDEDEIDEESVEDSLMEDEESGDEIDVEGQMSTEETESDFSRDPSPCPAPRPRASNTRKSIIVREIRSPSPDGPALPSDGEEAQLTETEEAVTESAPNSDSEFVGSGSETEDSEAEWEPSPSTASLKTPRGKTAVKQVVSPPATIKKLEQRVANMDLSDDDSDDPLPKPRKSKGKKILGKGTIIRENQLERMSLKMESSEGRRPVRRIS